MSSSPPRRLRPRTAIYVLATAAAAASAVAGVESRPFATSPSSRLEIGDLTWVQVRSDVQRGFRTVLALSGGNQDGSEPMQGQVARQPDQAHGRWEATGASGDAARATPERGRKLLALRVDAAVAQIRRETRAGGGHA